MPKFSVTGPNGRKITITGDTPPSEQELDQIFSSIPQVDTPAPEQEDPGIFGRAMDIVGRIGNTLGRPGAVTTGMIDAAQKGESVLGAAKDALTPTGIGTWKETKSFDDVLGNAGMDEGWKRAALGFVGDVVVDPINLVPGAVLSKVVKAPFKAAGSAAKMIPGVEAVTDAVKSGFVQHNGLEKFAAKSTDLNLKDLTRLHESTLRHEGEASTELAKRFTSKEGLSGKGTRPLTHDEATSVLYQVDQGGRTHVDPRIEQAMTEWRGVMDKQLQDKLAMGSIDASKIVPNYVPYQTKSVSADAVKSISGAELRGKTASDKARETYKTLQDAVNQGGASDNAQEVMAQYVSQTQKARRTNDFLSMVGQEFGDLTAKPGTRTLNRQMFNVPDQTWKALEKKHFPKEVADHLERAVQLWEKPEEIDNIAQTALKVWKSMATSINPGHHFTNFYGNVQNMYISGMSMKDIASGIIKMSPISYAATPAEKIAKFPKITTTIAGKARTYMPDELYKLANDYEIVGTSSLLAELGESTSDKIVNNPVFKYGRKFGTEVVEEPARLTLWLDGIRKGMSPEKSAIRVKDVLFDYAELTDKEKKIRQSGVIPFYTWMRKNIPLQVQMIGENPKKVERLKDFANIPWNARGSEVEQSVIPEDSQNAGFVPGPMTGPTGGMVMQKVNLPQNDLNRISDPKTILDALGPMVKMPIELAYNTKSFGGKVRTDTGLAKPAPAAAMLAPLNRVLPEAAQGYITPTTDAMGRQRQDDVMAWAMANLIPTGVWGSTASVMQNNDPLRPALPQAANFLSKFTGTSADELTMEDQKYAMMDKVREAKRQQMRKLLLER